MIIDETLGYIFQHIPKTGGTFIRHALLTNIPTSYTLRYSGVKWYIKESEQHKFDPEARNINGTCSHAELNQVKEEVVKDHVLWIAVRHPIEMWISNYIDVEHRHWIYGDKVEEKPNPRSFHDFMDATTNGFDRIESLGRKIKNAMEIAQANAGFRIIRQENLETDILGLLYGLKDFKVSDRLHFSITQRKYFLRESDPEKKREIRSHILRDRALCNKIMAFESFLSEYFYNQGS